jgi:hypothetical protein
MDDRVVARLIANRATTQPTPIRPRSSRLNGGDCRFDLFPAGPRGVLPYDDAIFEASGIFSASAGGRHAG